MQPLGIVLRLGWLPVWAGQCQWIVPLELGSTEPCRDSAPRAISGGVLVSGRNVALPSGISSILLLRR